jgi:putative nucleotidyltransferase with HDIG domain
VLQFVGGVILLAVVLFMSGCMLQVLQPALLSDTMRLFMLLLVSLAGLVPAAAIIRLGPALRDAGWASVEFLLPYALPALLATLLAGRAAGVVVGFWFSLTLAVLARGSLTVLLAGLLAALVTAAVTVNVRRRLQVLRIGLAAGLAQAFLILALAALLPEPPLLPAKEALSAVAGGVASAVVVLLILPLFESVFDVTTDITLLELSDLGHPLLQRLAIEAPGTYHHSLLVASLAQAAAEEIRANALLARVCAYFHDIGKLTTPQFFTENASPLRPSPHEQLSPHISHLIITAHVKEGLSLAMMYKLPRVILDVIQQHHGTAVVTYFHHKARQQEQAHGPVAEHRAVDEAGFRYPGPRPVSREATIIALADPIEAASRSLERPTPAHVQEVVDQIIESRLADGQLDACEMTMAELSRVRRAFVSSLNSILHSRIAYPNDEPEHQQPAGSVSR